MLYVSIDPATRTFAFAVVEVADTNPADLKAALDDIEHKLSLIALLIKRARDATAAVSEEMGRYKQHGNTSIPSSVVAPIFAQLEKICEMYEKATAGLCKIAASPAMKTVRLWDAETVDLSTELSNIDEDEDEGGGADIIETPKAKKTENSNHMPLVQRITAVVRYLSRRVTPSIGSAMAATNTEKAMVLIEYQLGANDKTRAVVSAIIAHYALDTRFETALVGPALKSRISVGPEFAYSKYLESRANSYSANKAHAVDNFRHIAGTVPSSPIVMSIVAAHNDIAGHVADAIMQAIAHHKYVYFKQKL